VGCDLLAWFVLTGCSGLAPAPPPISSHAPLNLHSQVLAERAAWDFVGLPPGGGDAPRSSGSSTRSTGKVHFDLITMCPIFATGPSLAPGQVRACVAAAEVAVADASVP
jgi:hypothetical protein